MNIVSRYFMHAGRISKGVWFARLVVAGVYASAFGLLVDAVAGPVAAALVAGAFLVSAMAISVQRLHDAGDSSAWLLVLLLPVVGPIWLLLKLLRRSVSGPNRYGADPGNRLDYLKVDTSK